MDNKSWLWKKRSTEKTFVADKANSSLSISEEQLTQAQVLLSEKAELERDIRILNCKLSSALAECNAKDDFAKKQVKIAREAIAGWEKAEAQAITLKQELDNVLQQRESAEERLARLDAALKECMQHLQFVRKEQGKRIQDAMVKMSKEYENTHNKLDEKLAEADQRLAKLDAENTQLRKALLGKDKLIEDFNKYKTQVETDLYALMSREEFMKKENASLKYEVQVLEKEFDIRNEEREFDCQTAIVAQKKHLESVKKIAKLESECQRLRLLVQKRLPGPAALTKKKDEVVMLGRDQVDIRGLKSYPPLVGSVDLSVDVTADAQSKKINALTEQLHASEEENRTLKETLNKKLKKLEFSRSMCSRAPSRFSQALMSDMGSDDKASCPELWASALISELEHFKAEKELGTPSHRTIGSSEMKLMDDFAEMEKLAVVSLDHPPRGSCHSSEEGNVISHPSGLVSRLEFQTDNVAVNKVPGWLGNMLKLILEQSSATQRSPAEILEDIKAALVHVKGLESVSPDDEATTDLPGASPSPEVSRHVYQKLENNSLSTDPPVRGTSYDISTQEKSSQKFQSVLSASIRNILELLEGIKIPYLENSGLEFFMGKDDKLLPYRNSEFRTGYLVRVFQWKISELSSILQQFVSTCKDLLNGTADLEKFAQHVASTLEWIMNHCFTLQDVSSMEESMRYHFDWDDSQSESELDNELINQCALSNKLHLESNGAQYIPTVSSLNDWNSSCRMEEVQQDRILNIELKNKSEMENMKQLRTKIEDQRGHHNMLKEDPETQLNLELDKDNLCSLNELIKGNGSCRRLEATRCELQMQRKGMTSEEVPDDRKNGQKQLKSDCNVMRASETQVECQETMLNLGKEDNKFTSATDAATFDKLILASKRNVNRRSSLLDKMLAEDNVEIGDFGFLSSQEHVQQGDGCSEGNTDMATEPQGHCINSSGNNQKENRTMAISPCKKKDVRGLLEKLMWRRKKGSSKKTVVPKTALALLK